MPSLITEGLILKRKDFGEADRILTALTDRYGKISIVARGVRKITSRRAGNIELLNRVKLHLFKAKSYTLTEAESIETFPTIKSTLTLSTNAFHILELVDRLIVEEQSNKSLYDLTVAILQLLENNPRQIFMRAYEVKMLSLLGFWSSNAVQDLDPSLQKIVFDMEYLSWQQIEQMQIDQSQAMALESIMHSYIEKILEGSLKSMSVLKKLKK